MFVVAHRTPPTSQGCAALFASGVRHFELDVQLSRDGLVVSHFLPVLRVRGWLENDNWRVRWRSTGDPSVPDVLARIPAGATVLLDPKETDRGRRAELVRRVCELPARERFVVSTSDRADLAACGAAGLRTWRTVTGRAHLAAACADGPLPDEGVSVRHPLLDGRAIERLHAVVGSVIGWTVNDVRRAQELVRAGIDGITTDRAERMITEVTRYN